MLNFCQNRAHQNYLHPLLVLSSPYHLRTACQSGERPQVGDWKSGREVAFQRLLLSSLDGTRCESQDQSPAWDNAPTLHPVTHWEGDACPDSAPSPTWGGVLPASCPPSPPAGFWWGRNHPVSLLALSCIPRYFADVTLKGILGSTGCWCLHDISKILLVLCLSVEL